MCTIFRKIEQHMNNLEVMSSAITNESQHKTTLRREKNVRKREVLLARISVYIVVLMVSCHMVRIIPTVWEIVQTLNMDTETKVLYWQNKRKML